MRVLNTDAEGRLVLADALWYTQDRFKPAAMINLATLTGAILVALGQHQAGLFSNDGMLSASLVAAGAAVGERLWSMPLGEEYDKVKPTVPKGGTGNGVRLLDRLVADNYEG